MRVSFDQLLLPSSMKFNKTLIEAWYRHYVFSGFRVNIWTITFFTLVSNQDENSTWLYPPSIPII